MHPHKYIVAWGLPKEEWLDRATTLMQYKYPEMHARYIMACTERELRVGDVMPITRRGVTIFFVNEDYRSYEGTKKVALSIRYQVPESTQVEVLVRGYDDEVTHRIQDAFTESAGDWYTPVFVNDLKG